MALRIHPAVGQMKGYFEGLMTEGARANFRENTQGEGAAKHLVRLYERTWSTLGLQAGAAVSKTQFTGQFRRWAIRGLERDSDPNSPDYHVRFILEQFFGCALVYHRKSGLLIIVSLEERDWLVAGGLDCYQFDPPFPKDSAPQPSEPSPIPETSPPTGTALAPVRTILSHIDKLGGVPSIIERRRFQYKEELKLAVVGLLQSGEAELAATLLFSSTERPIAAILEIVRKAAADRDIFDGYENVTEAIRLAGHVSGTQIFEGRTDRETLLLGYLLGRYASAAPHLAARVIETIAFSWAGTIRDMDWLVDIFAYMERTEYRADAVFGLTISGNSKLHRLADKIFARGLDTQHSLYHDRFQGALSILHGKDRECFLSVDEYRHQSVYRSPKNIKSALLGIGVEARPEDGKIILSRERDKWRPLPPDEHLRESVRRLLDQGQNRLAAQLAFEGYQNVVLRFASLTELEFRTLGRLLGAVSSQKRGQILVDLVFSLRGDERDQKIAEEAALAMLWMPNGLKEVGFAAVSYHEMVMGERDFAGARFAARKLLMVGSTAHHTCADYGEVYDLLVREYPEIYQNDWHQFVGTDGRISSADAPTEQRDKQLRHYYDILRNEKALEDDRIMAANMLGKLGAVEYFSRVFRIAQKRKRSQDALNASVLRAVGSLYGRLNRTDPRQARIAERFVGDYLVNPADNRREWFIDSFFSTTHDPSEIPILACILNNGRGFEFKAVAALGKIGTPAVPVLVKALEHGDWAIRQAVVTVLGEIGHPSVVQPLEEALGDQMPQVRLTAVEVLARIGSPSVVPALIGALKSGEKSVQKEAARALGKIGDPSAVPTLREALTDADPGIRSASAEALGLIGDPSAIPDIETAFRDNHWAVKQEAAMAWLRICCPSAILVLQERHGDKKLGVEEKTLIALEMISPPVAVPALKEALKDHNGDIRRKAAEALGLIGDPSAVPILETALIDPSWAVRSAASEAWLAIRDPSAIQALQERQRDKKLEVWEKTLMALEMIGPPVAVPALQGALMEERASSTQDSQQARHHMEVRIKIMETAGRIGPAALPVLEEGLKDKGEDKGGGVRSKAAEALGLVGDPSAVPILETALMDPSWAVRSAASEAWLAIRDPSAILALQERQRDKKLEVWEKTLMALEMISPHAAVPALEKALEDYDNNIKRKALEALGTIGDSAAVAALTQFLSCEPGSIVYHYDYHQKELDLKKAAADQLIKIGGPAIAPLQETLSKVKVKERDGDQRSRIRVRIIIMATAGRIGLSAIPILKNGLKDKEVEVRLEAIESLKNLSDRSAIPALEEAFEDGDLRGRASAVRAWLAICEPLAIRDFGEDGMDEKSWSRLSFFRDVDTNLPVDLAAKMLRLEEKVITALERVGPRATRALKKALGNRFPQVREKAAEALGRVGDAAVAIPALEKAIMKDTDPDVRRAAEEACRKLRGSHEDK